MSVYAFRTETHPATSRGASRRAESRGDATSRRYLRKRNPSLLVGLGFSARPAALRASSAA